MHLCINSVHFRESACTGHCCDNKHRHNISEYIDYTEPGENDFRMVFVISLFSSVGSYYYVPGMM